MYDIIAGYNTMTEEQKENVEIKSISRIIGVFFYSNSVLLLCLGLLDYFVVKVHLNYWGIFFFTSIVFLVIKLQKYDGN
ncbi:DUF3784 domain-containing protein [Mycoplasmatota bacterium WC44]